MKKTFVGLTATLFLSSCVAPTVFYSGPQRDNSQIAVYSRFSATSFLTEAQIYTLAIDGRDLIRPGNEAKGQIALLPGTHRVKVSFLNYKPTIALIRFTSSYFKGSYDVQFEAKAGYLYAPMFNLKLQGDSVFTEMCVGEASVKQGWKGTHAPSALSNCVKPTLPVEPGNFTACADHPPWSEECKGLRMRM